MVNSEEFSKRLERIMDRHELNASSFAEQVGVGRSSISHLLSGRNKPSLDFVLSVLKQFPDVDLYWLLNGKGTYPKTNQEVEKPNPSVPAAQDHPVAKPKKESVPSSNPDLFSEEPPVKEIRQNIPVHSNNGKDITRVILFYEDGSFESFDPN
jgi:transcriptional regulator with XRE-family HTH domain